MIEVIGEPSSETCQKLAQMQRNIEKHASAIVAFSGGVDSTLVLKVAFEVLGDRVFAFTARSASLMSLELEEAMVMAREIGVRHEIIDTHELDRPGYVANAVSRCYYCKTELFEVATLQAQQVHAETAILDGLNADDVRDHAEGRRAAQEHGVQHPLLEVGLNKVEVRALSRSLGLRTWNKPQLACMSSRIPHGVPVTRERLGQIEQVEVALRRLGFMDLRARLVRANDDMVRIELGEHELTRAIEPKIRAQIVGAAHQAGFRFIALDMEGFRSGRLNESVSSRLVQIGSHKDVQ